MSDKVTQNSKPELLEEIEQLREQLNNLTQSKIILQAIMDHSPALISAKDLQGNVILTNKQFEVLEGPTPEQYIGKNVYDLFPYEIADALWKNDLRAINEKKAIESEEVVFHKDKTRHVYYTIKFPLYDKDGKVFASCAFSVDITANKQAEEDSIKDALTGLYNRRYFNDRFEEEMRRANRENRQFVFLMIDVDHFKEYNDHYGHKQGDIVLTRIGEKLTGSLKRPGDLSFRLGGEEFGCILAVEDPIMAEIMAEQIRENIRSLSIEHAHNHEHYTVTVSIGVKVKNASEHITSDDVYQQADQALYLAKSQGRNRVCVAPRV